MVTKYNTGDAILIPATIRSAEEINGQIIYHVDADTWNGIPEDAVVVNDNAEAQRAMQSFLDEFKADNDWR